MNEKRQNPWVLQVPLWCLVLNGAVYGETLAAALGRYHIDFASQEIPDPQQEVNCACFDGDRRFGIAYRVVEEVKGLKGLGPTLKLLVLDKSTRTWSRGELVLKELKSSGPVPFAVCGSPYRFGHSRNFLHVSLHMSPSAATTLVLTRAFVFREALFGWPLATSPRETVVYRNSMVHCAPTHSPEISIYDPTTGFHRTIYPRTPLGSIRKAHVARIKTAYEGIGRDWFRVHNHHMDPARTTGGISYQEKRPVAINDATASFAFIVRFDDRALWDAADQLKEFYFGGLRRKVRMSLAVRCAALHDCLERIGQNEVDRALSVRLFESDPEIHALMQSAIEAYAGTTNDVKDFFTSLDSRWGQPGLWKRLGELIAVPPRSEVKVAFLYKDVYSKKGSSYQEFDLDDLRKRFSGLSDADILEALVGNRP